MRKLKNKKLGKVQEPCKKFGFGKVHGSCVLNHSHSGVIVGILQQTWISIKWRCLLLVQE